jgi:ubiquinone/menaquinone biosynthesis C-methylase UbiE
MDAENLALPDHVFDSVAFNLCLCTIPDPAAAVREGVRVAKPGAPDGLPRARAEPLCWRLRSSRKP